MAHFIMVQVNGVYMVSVLFKYYKKFLHKSDYSNNSNSFRHISSGGSHYGLDVESYYAYNNRNFVLNYY